MRLTSLDSSIRRRRRARWCAGVGDFEGTQATMQKTRKHTARTLSTRLWWSPPLLAPPAFPPAVLDATVLGVCCRCSTCFLLHDTNSQGTGGAVIASLFNAEHTVQRVVYLFLCCVPATVLFALYSLRRCRETLTPTA